MPIEYKEEIKNYLRKNLPNTDLTQLFKNLENDSIPSIFDDTKKHQQLIQKYKVFYSLNYFFF